MAKSSDRRPSFGASVPEARKIHQIVKRHKFPSAVKREFEVSFGEDSGGQQAVWIWFAVDEDLTPSAAKISELTAFVRSVRADLLNANLPFWPYVDVRTKISEEYRP
jgi:hypothetical protein